MNIGDMTSYVKGEKMLGWDKDNYWFIRTLIDNLKLSEYDKQVMHWCYLAGWELKSDGETGVKDMFMDGKIKDPAGVTHDFIRRVILDGIPHMTPDGHVWTAMESNALYRRIHKALGVGFRLRWRRWLGLTVSIPFWWKPGDEKKQK